MSYAAVDRAQAPSAFISSYAPRLRTYANALLAPTIQPQNTIPPVRTTKRGTTAINYAEDGYDDEDFDDSEGLRRPTGLRSLRKDDNGQERSGHGGRHQKLSDGPVDVQGIWREWMGKPSRIQNEKQSLIPCNLPVTLIPIKIDLEIPSFRPEAPFPLPTNARDMGIDENAAVYKATELTPPYSVKDTFLWNLHEAVITPDQFARRFVEELDFPSDRKAALVMQITNQIRAQLEEHAAVALHPLFQLSGGTSQSNGIGLARPPSAAVALSQHAQQNGANGPASASASASANSVTASAEQFRTSTYDETWNPDDAYRCIISLNVNLRNKLYSDRFEWSLMHPPGAAEQFARQTCADLGLPAEWVQAISHAIYEAVLKARRDVCENGALLLSEHDNDAAPNADPAAAAGWRYDPDALGAHWEPSLEELTKEEIEKREYDRERQLRRARRDTARGTLGVGLGGALAPPPPPPLQTDYFALQHDTPEQPMGRGERRKTKRRFRSLSPAGRETPDAGAAGAGHLGGALRDDERQYWRCAHCHIPGSAVWAVKDGPNGPRTLCHNCGFLLERDKRLPPWSKDFFASGTSRR